MAGLLGKYRLDARLGGGGMAEVFLGSTVGAEGFSRRVAIKRVLPGYSDNPQFAKMFTDEARISSRLAHPNIVSVVDFDRDADGRLFLVMELVEGRDLDSLVQSGPLPYPVVIFIIGEVLRGLGHAHDLPVVPDSAVMGSETIRSMRGIVHRDVSPHNVLLSWEGEVKVSDFGIAKARTASSATASEFIKGKPAYMSPEQANGQALDGRSDLFAVGVMLWEMLVGRRLFVGEDTRATLAAVLFAQIPRPRSLRGDVPKDLERVTMKLLERDLPARYANAEQAIHDLLECTDAPRSGREQLRRVLAERFPQQAPIRHSTVRRGGEVPPHERETIAATPAAAHSLGAMRNAPTGLAQRQRRTMLIAVAVLVAVVGTIVTIAVATSSGKGGAGGGSAGSSVVAAAPPVVVDAAPAAPPDAAPPPDAPGPADAATPQKDATVPKAGEKRMGRLIVTAFPVLTVFVDNKKIHDTPVDMQLPIGKHKVRLVNIDGDRNETLTVTIDERKPTTIDRK